LSDAWLLAAARSPRRPPTGAALDLIIDPMRRCLGSAVPRGNEPARLLGAGPAARLMALAAGLPIDLPAVGVDGGGLAALELAAHAVSGDWSAVALVAAVTAATPAHPPTSARLAWAYELADSDVAGARLVRRAGLDDAALLEWTATCAQRRANAAPRPRLQNGGDIGVTPSTSPQLVELAAVVRVVGDAALSRSSVGARARIAAVAGRGADPADPFAAAGRACGAALLQAGLRADQLHALTVSAPHAAVAPALAHELCIDMDIVDSEGGVAGRGYGGAADGLGALVDLLDLLDDIDCRYGMIVEQQPFGQAIATVVDREVWA
jgi:acetyl-CoA acetyltransferase